MTLGALRPVTRRVLVAPTWKTASATGVPFSAACPRTTPRKVLGKTPADPITSLTSETRVAGWWGWLSLWKGKFDPATGGLGRGTSWKVLPPPACPGLTLFLIR